MIANCHQLGRARRSRIRVIFRHALRPLRHEVVAQDLAFDERFDVAVGHQKVARCVARVAIAERIGKYCKELEPEEYDRLLDLMAGVHYKYEVLPHIPDLSVEEYLKELRALRLLSPKGS